MAYVSVLISCYDVILTDSPEEEQPNHNLVQNDHA